MDTSHAINTALGKNVGGLPKKEGSGSRSREGGKSRGAEALYMQFSRILKKDAQNTATCGCLSAFPALKRHLVSLVTP